MNIRHTTVRPIIASTEPFKLACWLRDNFQATITNQGDTVIVNIGDKPIQYEICRAHSNNSKAGVLTISLGHDQRDEIVRKFRERIVDPMSPELICTVFVDCACAGYVRFVFVE